MVKLTQTIESAQQAVVDAGYKMISGKFFDPRKRGSAAHVTLTVACNEKFESMAWVTPAASTKKGGPSGEFCAEIRKVVEAHQAQIIAGT
jgi:hypothetical protein